MNRLLVLVGMMSVFLVVSSDAEAQQHYNHLPTSGMNVFPFNTNPSTGKRVQWVVAAGEFTQPAPAPTGRAISSLWILAGGAGNATYANLTVRMANVSTSTYLAGGAFYTGSMTTLLSQNTVVAPTGALTWVEIPLTTPFPYDPTLNLIVEVSQCGFTGTGFSIPQTPLATPSGYRRQYSDANSACGAVVLGSGGDNSVPGIGLSLVPSGPAPPVITKLFGAAAIATHGTTTMTLNLLNPNPQTALSGVGVSDTFPAGLVVATPNDLVSTCSGVSTAVAATGFVSLTAASLAPSTSCSLTVNVRGTTLGVKTNTTGAVTSTESGPGGTASATLTVMEPIPTLSGWALALLAALLGWTTMRQARQRRRTT